MNDLFALTTHARDVPSESRERFADSLGGLGSNPSVVLLRTCHRVEVYACLDARDGAVAHFPKLPAGGRRLDGEKAVRHLFAVAAGFDSVVVGEDQILHQLRDCLASRQGSVDAVIDRLFQSAIRVGRESRSTREGAPRSLADVALDRIAAAGGSLSTGRILVVGAGQMGRLAALCAHKRGAQVDVTNRSAGRAAALAAEYGGSAIEFGTVDLAGLTGIVVAIGGRWTLRPEAALALAAADVPVADLSSPPAVMPDLRRALGSRHVSVDDLAAADAHPVAERTRRRVERIIDESAAEFGRWLATRSRVPAIQALSDMAETRRAAEFDKLLRRLPDLPEHERALVEQMSHRLVAGLLHEPLNSLRNDDRGDKERAARELFSL